MQGPALGIWRCQRAAGAALVVASALAFALDGPMARAAYQQGLDPAAFGFWRALAGAVVLGGFLVARPRPGTAGLRAGSPAGPVRPLTGASWPHLPRSVPLVRLEQRSGNRRVKPLAQDKQWFVHTLRHLGYTEAAEEADRELPDSVSLEEIKKFTDRYNISRDEVMSQLGGSP